MPQNFDPFTGGGSTGIACAMDGYRFVGAESSEHYAAIAQKRIDEAVLDEELLAILGTPP